MKYSIKVGDTVKIISGCDKGSVGIVLKMKNDFVFVSGVKLQKKSVKNSPENESKNFISRESPIHISNVVFQSSSTNTQKSKHSKVKNNTKK